MNQLCGLFSMGKASICPGAPEMASGMLWKMLFVRLEIVKRDGHLRITAILFGGIGAILLGLPYIFHAFGPTEAEVVIWGRICLCMGVALLFSAIGLGRSKKRLAKVALAFGYIVLALLQVPPVVLWFAFHGTGISDGAPPSTFVAHWAYSVPHLVLLGTSLIVVCDVVRAAPPLKTSAHHQSDQGRWRNLSRIWPAPDSLDHKRGIPCSPLLTHQPFQGMITSQLEGTVALWASTLSRIQTRPCKTFTSMVCHFKKRRQYSRTISASPFQTQITRWRRNGSSRWVFQARIGC